MALYSGTYYYASGCAGLARPGAKALMSWYLGAYSDLGAANLGIYVCKTLGSGYSIHADGRACDLGTKPYNNPGGTWPKWGWTLANALRGNSAALGIQLIIFNGKVWSCKQPDAGWRDYYGSDPHDGHMHVELTPTAAASLTVVKIQSVLGGATPQIGGIMLPSYGDTSEEVRYWQRVLIHVGEKLPKYGADRDYGDETVAAVKSFWEKRTGNDYHGRSITSAVALELHERVAEIAAEKSGGGVSQDAIAAAVATYLKAHPPKDGEDGKTPTQITLQLTGDVVAVE